MLKLDIVVADIAFVSIVLDDARVAYGRRFGFARRPTTSCMVKMQRDLCGSPYGSRRARDER
jgi:hypothetical protein